MPDNILDKIKETVEKLDEIDDYFEKIPELQSNIDSLISDYRHLVRDNILSESASIVLIKKLHEAEVLRKEINEHKDLANVYEKGKGKLLTKDNRQFLLSDLHKKVKEWQYDYKFRVLKKEDIDNILNEKKKRGRPKKENEDNGNIQENK